MVHVALSSKKVETDWAKAVELFVVWNCKVTFGTLFEPEKCGYISSENGRFSVNTFNRVPKCPYLTDFH